MISLGNFKNLTKIATQNERSFENLTEVKMAFANTSIEEIPDKLFYGCNKIKNFNSIFANCDKIKK